MKRSTAVSGVIPYGRQDISQADIDAVVAVLRSDFLTQGPAVPRFEEAVARYCGAPHAVAVNSATSALHIACLALGLGRGDRLWTSPNSFVASANCARYCGAEVDFVDIDPATYNLDLAALAEKLCAAERDGTLPKVLVPVHFAGQSCPMAEIRDLAARYGFAVIEDASHAVGGRYRDQPIGGCGYSDITVFSFHPVKIVTTGEGGMALCRDPQLAERMRRLRSHGITRDPALFRQPPGGAWYYEQLELGFNYRMTDIQAALGLSQMARLDGYVARRNQLAAGYDQALRELPLVLPARAPECLSSFHLYVVQVEERTGGIGRDHVFRRLRDAGIGVNLHYIPIHTQPYYRGLGFDWGHCPRAERYAARALTLPLFPTMTQEQQATVARGLSDALS
jgi:UDP-4-amino-4,6-dideoxy-N-acetyl-beta-L-altrosamine transaminase